MVKYVLSAVMYAALVPFVQPLSASEINTYFDGCASRTGTNATVIITSSASPTLDGEPLAEGIEIAVFDSSGLCAGVGTWDGRSTIITVWGNDTLTEEKDGLADEEQLEYRIWDPASNTEINSTNAEFRVTYDTISTVNPELSGGYSDGAIFHVSTFDVALGPAQEVFQKLALHPNYPNPASDVTTFAIDLPERSVVHAAVFDLLGRRVAVVHREKELDPGRHEMAIELGGLSSGTYILRLFAGKSVRNRAFKVVRH